MAEYDEAAMPSAAFRADLASLREHVTAALDRSIDRCARCKVCDAQVDAVMSAIGAEFDRLRAALEHAEAAAAGSHEGIRLWMLDCGELVAQHRARAEAAEARLAEVLVEVTALRAHALLNGIPLADLERIRDVAIASKDGSDEEARDGR